MRFLKNFTFFCVLGCFNIFLSSNRTIGQEDKKDNRPITYYMDVIAFPKLNEPALTKTEVIFGFELKQLDFEKLEDNYFASFELQVNLFDSTNQPVDGKFWKQVVMHPIKDFNISSKSVLLKEDFTIKPGKYLVKSILSDSISGRKANLQKNITVKEFDENQVGISDIEFASKIELQKGASPFNKYGITVFPKPNRVYRYDEKVFFYCELINLIYDDDSSAEYTVKYRILDQNDKAIIEKGPVKKKKMGTSSTEASAISVRDLMQGNYQLEIIVTDDATDLSDSTRAFFTVLREDQGEHVMFTEKMAEAFYHMVIYIMTDYERELYEQLNLEGKKQFMINFWKGKDPKPESPKNVFQAEIYTRWKHVSSNFGGIEKGWRTDQGRIFMKYGAPSQIDRYLHEVGQKPHEIWKYDRGNMTFVFVELRTAGDFIMVSGYTPDNSEIYDPDWQRWLK